MVRGGGASWRGEEGHHGEGRRGIMEIHSLALLHLW